MAVSRLASKSTALSVAVGPASREISSASVRLKRNLAKSCMSRADTVRTRDVFGAARVVRVEHRIREHRQEFRGGLAAGRLLAQERHDRGRWGGGDLVVHDQRGVRARLG